MQALHIYTLYQLAKVIRQEQDFTNTNEKIAKYLIALSILLGIAGCSPSFTYNNLGWLSGFWIDDYVDLNSEQADKFKHIVQTSRDWHRETQLPLYKRDLEHLKSLLDKNVSHDELKTHFLSCQTALANISDKT